MRKHTFTYIGDMRCNICGKYHKTSSFGRGDKQVLKMYCSSLQVTLVKIIGCNWVQEADFWPAYDNMKQLVRIGG